MSNTYDSRGGEKRSRVARFVLILGALYLVQSAYIGVESSPGVFYVGSVFVHYFGGLALCLPFLWLGMRGIRAARSEGGGAAVLGVIALALFIASVVVALVLVRVHNVSETRWILYLHILLASLSVAACLAAFALHASTAGGGFARGAVRLTGLGLAAAAVMVVGVGAMKAYRPPDGDSIRNPERPPFEMAGEAMGEEDGPFFPSSASTSTGGLVPSDFFMTSETCRRCHEDIYEQWKGSAHHFSSFNNQWYRKSIEYMQQVNSVEASKWCAGCHDHAVLFNGMMDQPVETFLSTQEAHTGISCNSCHAITSVKGSMGNGGFHIEYPPLHDLATSENPALRWLHDFSVQLDPGPHKRVFLKPFHREQTAEFCASCHKVHLDEPVNNYRWLRGFNEYDNWQASGVSGLGARSFYYPEQPMDCADCHMPLAPSEDKGHIDGKVHDHSFATANTALPVANLDEAQLRKTIEFLQRNQVSVDIFAAGPARAVESGPAAGARPDAPRLASTFAVGEEAAMAVGTGGRGGSRELSKVWAPVDRADIRIRRGDEVRVDVVVRTRNVGHFFPGGTIDAFDVWLELRAIDDRGQAIFWSGVVRDGGAGPVDEGAHFYGARMVDARGNRIDKRNAWATRAVAWINLIPPGAADVAHYRLAIPEDCGDTLTLEARLNYRKFSPVNTGFSFAGTPAPGEPAGPEPGIDRVSVHHDDRTFVTGSVPVDVSAAVREIPELPIVVIARNTATLQIVDGDAPENVSPEGEPSDYSRWNDYGIGLLRQGDLQGAKRAFEVVTELYPGYADGWVNVARATLQEGLLEEAAAALERALAIEPNLAKSHYFLGVALKEQGEYDRALDHMRRAAAQYPRDRVVRNGIARILFLQRRFEAAVEELKRVLEIDPEDLMAHYNLMLCYRGLGRNEEADEERRLYERFKADEDADIILGPYLRDHPEDNRMRQPIHEQVSVAPEVIARETAIREADGEPHVVLPGMAADYARRVVERGRRLMEEGLASERYLGPVEAGVVRPVAPSGEPGRDEDPGLVAERQP